MLAVITDNRTGVDSDNNGSDNYFEAVVVEAREYYPFGMVMPNRKTAGNSAYRYGFNGKENDDEALGDDLFQYFGNRAYDIRIGRFLSTDLFAPKFPQFSPYQYAGNSPLSSIDINGDSLYLLFSVTNYKKQTDNAMFKSAALTRKYDIEHSATFDGNRDKVVILEVSDLSYIEKEVNKAIFEHSQKYGKTVEFGIWSHAGFDGPVGSTRTTNNILRINRFNYIRRVAHLQCMTLMTLLSANRFVAFLPQTLILSTQISRWRNMTIPAIFQTLTLK